MNLLTNDQNYVQPPNIACAALRESFNAFNFNGYKYQQELLKMNVIYMCVLVCTLSLAISFSCSFHVCLPVLLCHMNIISCLACV